MDDLEQYNAAKEFLSKRNIPDAISIYKTLMFKESHLKAEAAYSLGIIYEQKDLYPDIGDGDSESYYKIAEDLGYKMATYRVANLQMRVGLYKSALDRFKAIAEHNPSAAYWTFRILTEHSSGKDESQEARKYLKLAEEQGHIIARRIIIIEYLSFKFGFLKFIEGIFLYIKLFISTTYAVKKEDKLKYT